MVCGRFIHSANSIGHRVSRMSSLRIRLIVWIAIVASLLRENTQTTRELCNGGRLSQTKLSTLHIHHIHSDRRIAHCRGYHRQQLRFRRLLEGSIQQVNVVSLHVPVANRLSRVSVYLRMDASTTV